MEQVTVLMSTYNGEKYLEEQINSILNQENVKVTLIIRDDGSSDNTLKILKRYKDEDKLIFYRGENLGPAKSFFNLLNSKYVKSDNSNMYYAFSDQDDVWKENKLYRAIKILNMQQYKNIPSLYCADFQRIDENGNKLKNNFHFTTSTFNFSVVCSYCTGCTMVFNTQLYKKILNKIPSKMVMHDDWIHKVCLAIGGRVYFDSNYRAVLYRQHYGNVVGSRRGIFTKINNLYQRLFISRDSMLKEYQEIRLMYYPDIPEKNKKVINEVIDYKSKSFISRIKFLNKKIFRVKPFRLRKEFILGIIFKTY